MALYESGSESKRRWIDGPNMLLHGCLAFSHIMFIVTGASIDDCFLMLDMLSQMTAVSKSTLKE